MSCSIDQDFYRAGLPAWFEMERRFAEAASDRNMTMGEMCDSLNRCLDDMAALLTDRQHKEPERVFWLLDEALRFVSENTRDMGRGVLARAFPPENAGVPLLPYRGLEQRLDRMQAELEQRRSTEFFRL